MDANGNKYSVGDIVHIRITNIVETIGVFVRMPNGNDGLIRKSDFAWFNQNVIMKSFSVGDELDVEVIKELPDGRLNLSRKSLLPNPRTLKEGELVSCRVKEVKQFGLIVKLGDFTALIHKTELPPFVRYSENDSINCIVLKNVLDEEKQYNKVYLSILALHMLEIEKVASQLDKGNIVEAEVFQVELSKVIIKIGGAYGIIKKEDVSWNEIDRLEDVLYNGETIKAVYLKNDNGKLLFSLKLLKEKPYNEALYELSLSDLLKYIGQESNVFIGQAKQYPYGLFIENLYSVNDNQKGKLLIDPIYGYNLRAIIPNANFNVEENKYYKIELRLLPKDIRLERNQLFQFVAINVEEAENPYKTDVDLTFTKSTSPRDCVALAHTLSEVGKNMYSSKDRMFFELIQNADDAAAQDGVIVKVKTQGDFLVIRHNGYSFDKDDFEAITSSANGTKKANENKTGYKGIGFKSVFTDSDIVFIKTGGYQFKFDKNYPRFMDFERFYFFVNGYNTEQQKKDFLQKYSSERSRFRGVSDIPWQLEPIWIDNFPEELGDDFIKSNVAIALKLGETKILGDNGYSKAIEDIISNPCFMLFLRNTKRIDFNGRSVSRSIKGDIITLKNSFKANRIECFKREDFEIEVNNDVFEKNGIDIRISIEEQDEVSGKIIEAKFVDTHNQEIENIPKKIAINNSTAISFAIPIDEGEILRPNTKYNEISLFAFLPTLVKDFKFAFYINANFILDPPRQRILGDNPWNFYLMQEIARCLVQWCASLNDKKDKNALNILLPKYFDNNDADNRQLAEHFNLAYKTALESEAFILNHKGELAKQDEIIIDETGLSEIIGADLFCQLLNTEKCLPYGKIDSKILEEAIFEEIELLKFDNVIDVVTNNSIFNEWFVSAKEEQKKALYKWIVGKNTPARKGDLQSFVLYLPLFQFDTECKSCTEIDSSEYIITTEHIEPIKEILPKLGFVCSDNLFDKNHPLYEFVNLQDEEGLFRTIKESDFSELTFEERKSLFYALVIFDGVGGVKLKKEIALFKNMNGEFKTLGEMVVNDKEYPTWLNDYIIAKEEYFQDLDGYMISDECIFNDILQIHYSDISKLVSILELYEFFKDEWTLAFTRKLIDKNGATSELFSIVELTDGAEHYFIEKYGRINFRNSSDEDSIEYKLVRLALRSGYNVARLKELIYIDDKNIAEFTISPEVAIVINKKEYLFPLAELSADIPEGYATFNRIKDLLSENGSNSLFSLSRMKASVVKDKLKGLYTPTQYAFCICYNIANGITQTIQITDEQFVSNILDYFFENKIDVLARYIRNFSNQKIVGQFINSDDCTLESERLSYTIRDWADNEEKEKFLIALGVKGNLSDEIKRRKAFFNNELFSLPYSTSKSEITAFLNWCITLAVPFTKENQVKILKEMFSRLNIKTKYDTDDYQNVEEWNDKRYREFVRNKLSIYPIENEMPKRGVFENVHLFTEYEGDHVCLPCNRLYVNVKDKKIETVLMQVCNDVNIPFTKDDWVKLFMVSIETLNEKEKEIITKAKRINSLEEENRKKDEIIEQYRAKYGDLTDEDYLPTKKNQVSEQNSIEHIHFNARNEIGHQSDKVIERDGLSRKKQISAHLEAEKVIREKLENLGYDCSNWVLDDGNNQYQKSHSINQVENIITPEKERVNLVVKSVKGGYIYLSAADFEFLTSDSSNILMVWDGKNVHSVTAEDIFNKDSNVNLIFDTEYTPKHYYAALSKVFQYIKRTTFAVKKPSYNMYDSIKSFGMDSKTEGVQELFDDNDL